MNISQLSRADSISLSDLLIFWSSVNCDTRAGSVSLLLNLLQENLTASGDDMTQYAAPNATGFSVSISPVVDGQNVYLLLTPTGAFAAGTLVLPPVANCVDGQTFLMNTTQAVTALTLNGNGATVVGGPTTLAANAFFKLRFDGIFKNWYRVG